MTNELSGANNNVFKRTASNSKNIYLALDDGSEAGVGSTQSYLRVGAVSDNGAPFHPETAMVVAGKAEMRGGILIRKDNTNATLSNTGTNTQVRLSTDFTELDLNTTAGTVNFASKYDGSNPTNDTSFVFTADGVGASTSMGINTTTPDKTLDVEGDAAITDALIIGFPSTASAGTDKLKINGNTRADAYYYNSDRRYKSDIEVLSSPLANLLKISGYSYFNKLSQKQDIGIIAQEIETVYPQLVQTDAE